MRYLLLAYADGSWGESSSGEREASEGEEILRESGYLLDAIRLPGGSPTATLRVQNGQVSLNDGPLGEAKEQLVALFVLTARDLNEAVRVAAKMPQAGRGPIEVRALGD